MDARLRKRYAVPFASPVPPAVQGWLTDIVGLNVLLRRGTDPSDAQFQEFKAKHDTAMAEVREAADSVEGLFDLPLRDDTPATGITKRPPRGYSETSPYVFTDRMRRTGRDEDERGSGSYS
jgi:hypothetical protein